MLKQLIVKTLSCAPMMYVGQKVFRQFVPVFMMHRFQCPEVELQGHDLSLLRNGLIFLRKHRFNFVTVEQIAQAIESGEPLPERSIAFTLDDGYWEQIDLASGVFAEFDCPATYFVTSGFVSGDLWFWDAKIHFLIEQASSENLLRLQQQFPQLVLQNLSPAEIAEKVVFELTNLNMHRIEQEIADLAVKLDLELPVKAPEKYRNTTWHDLQRIENQGMKVGPHTYSHPLLSQENDEMSKLEISKSQEDVKKYLKSPANVFCYPVGRKQDFGEREQSYVKELGFDGAMAAYPGSANLKLTDSRFTIPRFSFPESEIDFLQWASWIEACKSTSRGL